MQPRSSRRRSTPPLRRLPRSTRSRSTLRRLRRRAAPAAAGGGTDLVAEIQKLAALKDAGVLSDEEFAAAKAKLLG